MEAGPSYLNSPKHPEPPAGKNMNKVNIGNTEHYTWGANGKGWHLLQDDTLSIIEEKLGAGGSEKRHIHHRAQQFFYVLAGTALIEIDGREHEIGPGSGIHVPPGVPHRLQNRSEHELHFLVISTPHSHGDRTEL